MLVTAWEKLVVFSSWPGVLWFRHFVGMLGSVEKILMCWIVQWSCKAGIASAVASERELKAASLAEAFGPRILVSVSVILPLKFAEQAAVAIGTPSTLLGQAPWQKRKSQSLFHIPPPSLGDRAADLGY